MGKTSSKAVQKYVKKAYDRIGITVKKGYKSDIQAHCAITGESVNAFIQRAIQTQIEIDEQTAGFLHKPDTSDSK